MILKAMEPIQMYAKGNKRDYRVWRVYPNGVKHTPRYVIWYGSLYLPEYKSTSLTLLAGLRIYRAKWFGGGMVFSSWDLDKSIKHIEKTLGL